MKILSIIMFAIAAIVFRPTTTPEQTEVGVTFAEYIATDISAPLPVCEESQTQFNTALDLYMSMGCNNAEGSCGVYLGIMGEQSAFSCAVYTDPDSDNGPSCGWVCAVSTCGGGCM